MRRGIRFILLLLFATLMWGCNTLSRRDTEFHNALVSGDIADVRTMVAEGADVNSYYKSLTPLHIAAKRGHKDIVMFLVAKDANINGTTNNFINTPLYLAAKEGHVDIVEFLLDNGADMKTDDKRGTPLHVAAYRNRPEVARLLIARGANVNTFDHSGVTPLHNCAMQGSVTIARMLLASGAKVDAVKENGPTPLYYAVVFNKPDMAELLIEHGADVNAKINIPGFTTLHEAAMRGNDTLITILVRNGANLNAHAKPFKQISQFYEPNPTYIYIGTALHLAAEYGKYSTFKLLQDLGADTTRVREDGKTAYEVALDRIEILEEKLKEKTREDVRKNTEMNLVGCKGIVRSLPQTYKKSILKPMQTPDYLNPKSWDKANEGFFRQQFADWEAKVEAKLQAGESWIIADKEISEYLSVHAHEQIPFLKKKLKGNMFVSQLLEDSEALNNMYGQPGNGIDSVQGRQKAWLKALNEGLLQQSTINE